MEAIIGLPAKLFYGTGIPACILVMRAKGAKPEDRRGKVLFINADAEYGEGANQNYLRPEHVEKIIRTFDEFRDVPGYAAVVDSETLANNNYNCNIRRYVDNAPPPEPHDVRAHLRGGVPIREIEAKKHLFLEHGFDPMQNVFVQRDSDYFDFNPAVENRSELKSIVENDLGVTERERALIEVFNNWWSAHQDKLNQLGNHGRLTDARSDLLSSFENALIPFGLLDRYKVAGVIASWWQDNEQDLRVLQARGFEGLIASWIASFRAEIEDENGNIKLGKIDLNKHRLVSKLLPEYLQELNAAESLAEELTAKQEAFEDGTGFDQDTIKDYVDLESGEEDVNVVKLLDDNRKSLANQIKDSQKRIKQLNGSARSSGSIAFVEKQGQSGTALRTELAALKEEIDPIEADIKAIESLLEPYNEVKKLLGEARKKLRELKRILLDRLEAKHVAMSNSDCCNIALDIFYEDLANILNTYIVEHRIKIGISVDNWWEKYQIPLHHFETKRTEASGKLNEFLKMLGYD